MKNTEKIYELKCQNAEYRHTLAVYKQSQILISALNDDKMIPPAYDTYPFYRFYRKNTYKKKNKIIDLAKNKIIDFAKNIFCKIKNIISENEDY